MLVSGAVRLATRAKVGSGLTSVKKNFFPLSSLVEPLYDAFVHFREEDDLKASYIGA